MLQAGKTLRFYQALVPPTLDELYTKYEQKHLRFQASATAPRTERIIIYEAGPNDGYGNRLPGLVTAFLWALLDDRILLVEWRDDPEMMPEPAPFHTLFAPANGRLRMDVDQFRLPADAVNGTLNGRQIWGAMSADNLAVTFPQRVVKFHSDDWLFPLLQANPAYRATIIKWFPSGRAFFYLSKFLLQLHPDLQAKLDQFKGAYFGPNVVGMHLRLQKVMPDDQGRKTLQPPSPETFFEAARMLQLARGMPDDATVFYVATETASAVAAAREWFGERRLRVAFLDDLFPMKRKDHRDADRGSLAALQNAIVEMRLLAEADEMIGTFASSYSYCASSWGNVVPYYIMPDRRYWYAGVSEPCFRHASRGHAELIADSPELLYHQECSVIGHRAELTVAERGKDGRLKTAAAPAVKAKPARHPGS